MDPTDRCPECGTTDDVHDPGCMYPYRPTDGEPTPWGVLGDDPDPIREDLTEAGARALLKALEEAGRTDCYAEHEATGETIEKPDGPILA
ncbi:hypothetical protein GCM10023196_037180 [Actinoallomurus vinaceus]|uniref:Uncharacterized protein n=1 Tax=Actinoallomurus vinaceus TaxID=1080074 RepID=A0ABP8UB86_9ACTN